jgi:hypothetical protein
MWVAEAKMNRIVVLLAAFLLLASSADAIMRVNVYVLDRIDGRVPFVDMPSVANNTPQKFLVVWENTGSVGCSFLMRADIYQRIDGRLVPLHTSWSKETPIEPGGAGNLEAFWYPNRTGDFSVETSLYYCNFLSDGPQANFSILKFARPASLPGEIRAESDVDYVDFIVNPTEDISSLVIVPSSYPTGWVFESGEWSGIEKGKEARLRLGYSAQIWKPSNVSFDVVSSDGRYRQSVVVKISKREEFPLYPVVIGFLVLLVIILSVKVFSYRRGAHDEDSDS